jgi:hypothetical protein
MFYIVVVFMWRHWQGHSTRPRSAGIRECPEAVRLLGLPDMPEFRLLDFLPFWKVNGTVRVNMASSKVARQSTNNIFCPLSLEEYEKYDIVWLRWGIIYFRGVYIKRNTGKFMSEISGAFGWKHWIIPVS